VARLAVPRAFTAGDQAELVSSVRNRTDRVLAGVKETLAASGAARTTGPTGASGDLGPGGESRRAWGVGVPGESPADGSDASARSPMPTRCSRTCPCARVRW